MKGLLATLNDYDPGMLPALAEAWGVASKSLADDEIIPQLQHAMLDPSVCERAWDNLDEPARAALQLLVSSAQQRMKIGQFERFYGKIRKLGRAQIEKEKPHQQGFSIAETLYYRGLIGEGFDKVGDNLIGFVYVPSDLIEALPLHKTSFENILEDEDFPDDDLPRLEIIAEAQNVSQADTSIVDDMTTMLAFLQANSAATDGTGLAADVVSALSPHLLNDSEVRLDFLLGIGISANLITTQDGKAYPRRNEARDWLTLSRSDQIRQIALAWLESQTYRDLWQIPGLYPDDSGWSYDAAAARDAVMSLLAELATEQGWLSVNDLVEIIKTIEPDFQRPDGDYDSWYIRNAAGEFLSGFESWDAVEGSLIEFYLVGPMYWLGLVDVGDDVARLTAYGRAFLDMADWPQQQEPTFPIDVRSDGTLLASRRVNRFERFQLARFARWEQSGDPYVYRLDADSIQRADSQGINTQHIQAFVARQMDGKPLPLPITKLLRNWRDGAKTTISFESVTVLRTNSEEALDKIYDIPSYRRYLGARLGPMACVIRKEHWRELRSALGENGIDVDISGIAIADD